MPCGKYCGQILGIGNKDPFGITGVGHKGRIVLPYRFESVSSEDENEREICCCKREEAASFWRGWLSSSHGGGGE